MAARSRSASLPKRHATWYTLDPPARTPPVPYANAPQALRRFLLDAKKADAVLANLRLAAQNLRSVGPLQRQAPGQ